jgi:hypothetical protein
VKDSSLVISKTSKLSDFYKNNFELREIPVSDIKTVRFLNTNNLIAAMTLCGIAGGIAGIIRGANEEDSPSSFFGSGRTAESKAAEDVFYGVIIGVGFGTLLGSIKIKIPINGNNSGFIKYKARLEKESVKYKYLSVQ